MGTSSGYYCSQCGYHKRDMVSGYDVGMMGHVVAISCADCRELRHAWLPGYPGNPEGDALALEIKTGRIPPSVVCERAPGHRISVWTAPGACPRCETTMTHDGSFAMWD